MHTDSTKFPQYNTKYFRTADEVEYVFGLTLSAYTRGSIEDFINARQEEDYQLTNLIRKMLAYEYRVYNDEEQWPWPHFSNPFVEVTELR